MRELSAKRVEEGATFSVLDLMDCIKACADSALTPAHPAASFASVGMWPLDPTKIKSEDMSKGADRAAADVYLPFLMR